VSTIENAVPNASHHIITITGTSFSVARGGIIDDHNISLRQQ
jgi:hypothetical protein